MEGGEKKNKSRNFGHLNGVKTVKKIVESSIKLKIPFLTFYVFSTENWRRPKSEINFLFKLIDSYFHKELKSVISNGIKINIIGRTEKLPRQIRSTLRKTIESTKKNKKITVNLAINYGSKDEIINALKKIKKKISIQTFEKKSIYIEYSRSRYINKDRWPQRLSNFMLWQLAYTEIYFLDKLWPDFDTIDLKKIVNNYKKIKRNFGAI